MSVRTSWMRSIFTRSSHNLLIQLLLILFLSTPSPAEREISRRALVLYNSEFGQGPDKNIVFEICQTILNYYGILPEYRDVSQRPLPDARAMAPYRAIITSFNSNTMTGALGYLSWLKIQAESGKRIVILGDPGAARDTLQGTVPGVFLENIFTYLGVDYQGERITDKTGIRYREMKEGGKAFERWYPALPESYEKLVPLGEKIKTYLSLERINKKDSRSSVVFTSPSGGYAREGFIYWQDPKTYRRQWYLDPFMFFQESLGLEKMPVPDPTTLNGVRVAFSHVDADGFGGISRIDKKSFCAEMIRDNILKRYAFPVTFSVIVGEIDPKANGNEDLVRLAREIFALPNVEPASHSYSHPFYWDPAYQQKDRYESQYGVSIPGYVFDQKMEIDYSVSYVTRELSSPQRPCRVFQWTGNCVPTESDIARCDTLGLLNINWGDTVLDEVNDSLTSVATLYRRVGTRFQFSSGQANDNIMTNRWTGPFYGYRKIITTMERTGYPRRLKPIDIYYHCFSAEYEASLKALQDVHEWVLSQEAAKVFTSEYLRMVQGFLDARVKETDNGGFLLEDYGECLTVRFDTREKVPDLPACENVLGYAMEPQGLYISLAPGKKRALIHLIAPGKGNASPARRAFVKKATGWVRDFQVTDHRATMMYQGFGEGRLEIAGMIPGAPCEIIGSALKRNKVVLTPNHEGVLLIAPVKTGSLEITWKIREESR